MNSRITKNWGNEGDIGDYPSHYIELHLFVEGRDIHGDFNVRLKGEDHVWNGVGIYGNVVLIEVIVQ